MCEAVGKPELVREAITLTRPNGFFQLVGVNPKGSVLPLDLWDVHFREIRFGGAFGRAAQLLSGDPRIDPGAFALVAMVPDWPPPARDAGTAPDPAREPRREPLPVGA